MFFRVDYVLAVIAIGAIAGFVAIRRAHVVEPRRFARGYLIAVAALSAVQISLDLVRYGGLAAIPAELTGALRDLGPLSLGVFYGVALAAPRSEGAAEVVDAPDTRFALCLATAVGFARTGVGKVVHLDGMLGFFAESGYSRSFLMVVIAGEVFAPLALVSPWRRLVMVATIALGIDMFGAIYTHVHNGDPLDDSTGAIAMLLRLGPIAVLHIGRRWAAVAGGAAACCVVAIAGGTLVRRDPPPKPPPGELDYFVGSWHCAGTFAATGAPIEADLRADRELDGRWLVMHHDDRPPGRYHALVEWSHGAAGWVGSIQDSFGGLRRFRSDGWDGPVLTWTLADGDANQRFRYQRVAGDGLEIAYETGGTSAWRRVDTVTCTRSPD
jgi:hypothetical protein